MKPNDSYYPITRIRDIDVVSNTTGQLLRTEQKPVIEGGMSIRDKLAKDFLCAIIISSPGRIWFDGYKQIDVAFELADKFIEKANENK